MMMAQDWGSQADAAATAMGVSATALAATCAMEFELPECWRWVRKQRGRRVPNDQLDLHSRHQRRCCLRSGIAGSIVSGLAGQMDPATEAYAASYELRTDALMLQNEEDISNPTVLNVRAVYQFGAGVGPEVAVADDSENIAEITGLSAASLAANGLTTSSTVGQWRATVIAKLGSATANQSVLAQ